MHEIKPLSSSYKSPFKSFPTSPSPISLSSFLLNSYNTFWSWLPLPHLLLYSSLSLFLGYRVALVFFLCGTFMPPSFWLALPMQPFLSSLSLLLRPLLSLDPFIQIAGVLSLPSPFLLGHFISSFISSRKYYVKSINLGSERQTLHVLTQLWSLVSHLPMCPCVWTSVWSQKTLDYFLSLRAFLVLIHSMSTEEGRDICHCMERMDALPQIFSSQKSPPSMGCLWFQWDSGMDLGCETWIILTNGES